MKYFTVEAEEKAAERYPEGDITYGYQAVREAFEAGVWWATMDRDTVILLPPSVREGGHE